MARPKTRKYFIDWLRITLIISVFFFHIGMIFNNSNWPIKNNVLLGYLDGPMKFFTLWRMPLLFLVSGIGTFYAIGFRTANEYLKERTLRLFIPYVMGIFTLIPIQVYFEKNCAYESFLTFLSELFNGIYPVGNFSWLHHLWFLKYLFLMSIIITPFLKYFKGPNFIKFKESIINFSSKKLGLNWFVLVLFLSQIFLNGKEQFFGINVSRFLLYFLFFIIGFLLVSDDRIMNTIENQKKLFLFQTIAIGILIFGRKYIFNEPSTLHYSKVLLKSFLIWSCAITVIGYFKSYFNRDSKFRKPMNEGIYPFYLLHQPVIIVVGFYAVNWPISIFLKVPIIIIMSLSTILFIYFLIVKPFNFTRIIFGLKVEKKSPYYVRYAKYSLSKIMSFLF